MNANLKNPITNQVKQVKAGFSWTTFFWGFFPALFRGDWKWFAIIFLIDIITGSFTYGFGSGIVGIIFSFFYNKLYITDLMNNGFIPADDASKNILLSKGISIINVDTNESTDISNDNTNIYVQNKPLYKRVWFWILAFIALVAIGVFIGAITDSNSYKKHTDSSQDAASSISEIFSSNDENESTSDKAVNNVPTGESTTLGAGTWTVGKDIKPGIYVLTTSIGSGNVSSEDSDSDDINIILSSSIEDADSEVSNYRAILNNGQKIKIEGLQNVNFQVDNPLGNTGTEKYISGQYIIGVDIKPGRYQIDADLGSGNIMTDDGEVNEILSTDPDENSISSTTVDLTKGQVLSTDLNRIQLTQK